MTYKSNDIVRYSFYFWGLVLLSLGIALTIKSNLGTSPYDSLLVGLYQTFGMTIGSWEYILGAILILLNACMQRKKPEILGMLTAFITGLGIDVFLFVLNFTIIPLCIWCKILFFLIGIILIGLGISTYLQAEFAPSPVDGMMLVVRKNLGLKITTAKNLLMLVFLMLAFLFHGPIAIGTLIIVLVAGPVIGFFFPYMEKLKNKKLSSLHISSTSL